MEALLYVFVLLSYTLYSRSMQYSSTAARAIEGLGVLGLVFWVAAADSENMLVYFPKT
jgi:hypothetical protein